MRNFRETIFPFRWNPSFAKGFQNRVKYRSFKDNFSVVKIGLEHLTLKTQKFLPLRIRHQRRI